MTFFTKSELEARPIMEGVTLKSISGEKTMITFFDLEPNSIIPSHSHHHEQITYILEGEMEFVLGGKKRILKSGDGVVVPSDTEHSGRILDKPTKALDAWYPIREDYK